MNSHQVPRQGFVILACLLVIFAFYSPTLVNGFVWDDQISFFENPMYRDPANIGRALTGALIYQDNFFRPLPVLTFLVQIHVFTLSPVSMHAVSLGLHLVNVLLVMLVSVDVLKRFGRPDPGWSLAVVGLFYGLHPALIEPVSFISSRFDMMMSCFLLLSLYADMRVKQPWLRASLVGLLFMFAALCKEMAIGFALALPLWHFFLSQEYKAGTGAYIRRLWSQGEGKVYLAVIGGGLVYLVLRYLALGVLFDNATYSNNISPSFTEHLALIGLSLFTYLKLLVVPFGSLNVAHALPEQLMLTDYRVILGYVFLVTGPLAAWLARTNGSRVLAGYGVVLAGMFAISGIIPLPRGAGAYFSESFLVLPVTLFALVLAVPLTALAQTGVAVSRNALFAGRGIALVWLMLAVVSVISVVPLWKNNITLWTWSRIENPNNLLVRNNLAAAFLVSKRYEEAAIESRAATQIDPGSDLAWTNLALGLSGLQEYGEAELAAQRAIALDPGKPRNHVTLARIYFFSRQYDKAEQAFGSILKRDPQNISATVFVAYVYRDTGRIELARQAMSQAITMLPDGNEKQVLVRWVQELPKG